MKYYLIFVVCITFFISCSQTKEVKLTNTNQNENNYAKTIDKISNNDSTIVWHSFEDGFALSNFSGRKIFVDIYTDWCGWCKKMDASTFKNKSVIKEMNNNYIAVKFNAEQKETLRFNDTEYIFIDNGRRGYHQFAALLLDGQMSYPSFTILEDNGKRLKKIVGYQSPEQLITALSFSQ